MGEKLKLVDAARIVVRPGPAIQFGIDATRCGVIDSIAAEHIGGVVSALRSARTGCNREVLETALGLAGLSRHAASSLVSELLTFGILRVVPALEPMVGLVGRGALAGAITELLRGSGVFVRRPLRGESIARFLTFLPRDIPLVAVDKLAHTRVLAPAVSNGHREFFLPVQLIDGAGLIGPLATSFAGPCPLCVQLHHTDVDSHWPHLLTQVPTGGAAAPITVAATAAHAAAVISQLVGIASPALGSVPASWKPDTAVRVDPFSGIEKFHLGRHPGCPVCFDTERGVVELSVSGLALDA